MCDSLIDFPKKKEFGAAGENLEKMKSLYRKRRGIGMEILNQLSESLGKKVLHIFLVPMVRDSFAPIPVFSLCIHPSLIPM